MVLNFAPMIPYFTGSQLYIDDSMVAENIQLHLSRQSHKQPMDRINDVCVYVP